jgi:Thioesterase-like superfamily
MALDESARIERMGEKTYAAQTDEAYWNAVGPFGGWIAAVLVRCVSLETKGIGDPLSLSVNFAGPMQPGTFSVRLRELRANRSTTFWSAELLQQQDGAEALCAFATIVIAQRRETPAFLEAVAPAAAPPEELHRFASVAARAFLKRFDMRFDGGGAFPKLADGQVSAWVRALDSSAMDYETLTAICDAGLPHIFLRLRRPVPVSTVTMNVFYHATRAELALVGDDFLLMASRMRVAGNGFFDASTSVWSRAGLLLATTEQVVWFKVPQ